jgi:hypothetical protein
MNFDQNYSHQHLTQNLLNFDQSCFRRNLIYYPQLAPHYLNLENPERNPYVGFENYLVIEMPDNGDDDDDDDNDHGDDDDSSTNHINSLVRDMTIIKDT